MAVHRSVKSGVVGSSPACGAIGANNKKRKG